MEHSRKNLVDAIDKNRIYDYIANNYYEMPPYELKEVLLAILGVCYDKCCGDEDEKVLMELIKEELVDERLFLEWED